MSRMLSKPMNLNTRILSMALFLSIKAFGTSLWMDHDL